MKLPAGFLIQQPAVMLFYRQIARAAPVWRTKDIDQDQIRGSWHLEQVSCCDVLPSSGPAQTPEDLFAKQSVLFCLGFLDKEDHREKVFFDIRSCLAEDTEAEETATGVSRILS